MSLTPCGANSPSPPALSHATAADFKHYVAKARAEGLSDAEIVERWMRQARPLGDVNMRSPEVTLWIDDILFVYHEQGSLQCDAPYIGVFGLNGEQLEAITFCSLESALAWLADQLTERCPVEAATTREESCGRGTMIRREWQCRTAIDHPESPGEYDREAARLRRMFGIVEPQEDSKEGGAE